MVEYITIFQNNLNIYLFTFLYYCLLLFSINNCKNAY